MDLGLSIFRVVRTLDPDILKRIRAMEGTSAYRQSGIKGVVETARETYVNIELPLSIEDNESITSQTKDFVILGPNGELVSRAASIVEAEAIVAGARVDLVTKIQKGVAGGAVPA